MCSAALSALEILSVRLGALFRSHVAELIPTLRERLADAKEHVRPPLPHLYIMLDSDRSEDYSR